MSLRFKNFSLLFGLALIFSGLFFSQPALATDNCFCYYTKSDGTDTCTDPNFGAGSAEQCEILCKSRVSSRKNFDIFFVDRNDYDGDEDAYLRYAAEGKDNCLQVKLGENTGSGLTEVENYLTPSLNVDIPGFSFSSILERNGFLYVDFISEYINSIYNYLLGAGAIIAVVMIMIGGVQYMIGSSVGSIDSAKKRITNAATGLVLLLGAYMILYTVNPKLTQFTSLELKQLDPKFYLFENSDSSGAITFDQLGSVDGIICPKKSGEEDLETIAKSFMYKTTYRMGGKGGKPPYNGETRKSIDGKEYKDFCPDGTICLDCSGFANILRACAGISYRSGGTSEIFTSSTEQIHACTSTSVNEKDLVPGDWIGYNSKDSGDYGHVYIYIGNGQVADSHGGGREPGKAIGIGNFSTICAQISSHPYRISRVN